jgi:hypothetical protein
MKSGLAGCLLIAVAASGCAGRTSAHLPSQPVERNVAGRFAAAVLRGDAADARALLVHGDEAALVFLVRRAAAPWKVQHAALRLPGRSTGHRWTFRYTGRRTHKDGRFETQRGDFVVFVGPSPAGAGVNFFAFRHVTTRFSTHHDSQLLPSKR